MSKRKISLKQKISSFFNRIRRKKGRGNRGRSDYKARGGNLFFENSFLSRISIFSIFNSRKSRQAPPLMIGVLVIIFITIGYIIISNIIFIKDLPINRYKYDSSESIYSWGNGQKLNIIVMGLDNSDDGNTYIDRMMLIYINPNDTNASFFGVSTDYSIRLPNGQSSTLKLALRDLKETDAPVSYIISEVEQLLALDINKYIIVEEENVDEVFGTVNLPEISIADTLVDPDFEIIPKGDFVPNTNQVYNFLASEKGGESIQQERLADFSRDFIDGLDSWTEIFSYKSYASTFSENFYTDLSKLELIRLFWYLRGLRSDQLLVAYTRWDSGVRQGIGGSQLGPIYDNIDRDLQVIYSNPEIVIEQAKVEIMNATEIPGIATFTGRQLENLGCRIVRVGNSSADFDKNYIYVLNPEEYPETIASIKEAFNGNIVVLREEFPYRYIGDIVVVIGEDFQY